MLLFLAVGAVGVWFLLGWLAWLYLFFALILIYGIQRKLVCTNCYYYDKWFSFGWGKLSGLMFKKGNIEDFATSIGLKTAPIVYGLIMIIPLIAIIISLVLVFDYTMVGVLILLVVLSIYSGGIGRKAACSRCKMRLVCPGSAVKQ
jgi:hypothetical protein